MMTRNDVLLSHTKIRRFHEFPKDSLECVAIGFLNLAHQSSQNQLAQRKITGKMTWQILSLRKNCIYVRDIVKLAT